MIGACRAQLFEPKIFHKKIIFVFIFLKYSIVLSQEVTNEFSSLTGFSAKTTESIQGTFTNIS